MSTECKYCNGPENKQTHPGLTCENCKLFVHLDCLRRPGTPGDFTGDVFFEFTCEDCSSDKHEKFLRKKFPWVNVVLLTLHHLSTQSLGISNNGFFHYKTHICSFIDRSWPLLFGPQTKQKKNLVGTIAGVLSVYSNFVFYSGSMELGETGWWRLLHGFSPAVAAEVVLEISRERPKGKPRNQVTFDKVLFTQKVTEMGYKHLIHDEDSLFVPFEPIAKKKRLDESTGDSDKTYEELMAITCDGYFSDPETSFKGSAFTPIMLTAPQHDYSSQPMKAYDSDSCDSTGPQPQPDDKHQENEGQERRPEKMKTEKPYEKRESMFSTELNSFEMPWVEKRVAPGEELVEMTPYEEIQLLKQLERLIPKVKDPNKKAYLNRMKAKLSLRRLKRHKLLPLFDLDKSVKILGGYMPEYPKSVMNGERVLDRFQRSYMLANLCGTVASSSRGVSLVGAGTPVPFRSPYGGGLLRPYVRRDTAARPQWLKLTDELLRRTNRHIKDYVPPAPASIDYSYVRPQHIPAVNSLCAQFFWPGIDLTEALEYPEYSCVVTYKRLVVGCAFLVPDVRPNEAYISFVLTRPEWRNAKIATFMLYHLLQTCSGKDVTLHVSPTNPAIFLYQKFGFKVEEFIQDFYEKYYDIDYKGCRHALFLRLIR